MILLSGNIKRQLCCMDKSEKADRPCLNIVQQHLWPAYTSASPDKDLSEAVTDICDEPGSWSACMPADAENLVCRNGNIAHTMQIGRILRPVPAAKGQQSCRVSTS